MAADTARDLLHDILGPIHPILAREDVTDLCINGPSLLFVEFRHGWKRMQADNLPRTWLQSFVRAVASYMSATISERAPILSGHLPIGERIQIVLPPAAEKPSITIRRPSHVTFTLGELAEKGAFAPVEDRGGRRPTRNPSRMGPLPARRMADRSPEGRPRHPPRDRRPPSECHRLRGHGLGQDDTLEGDDRRDSP